MTSEPDPTVRQRAAGTLLIASGALVVGLITHHPTAASGAMMIQGVHAALMSVILVMTAGFALYVWWHRTAVSLVGLIPFVVGAAAGFAAGTINGFISPRLAMAGVTSYGDLLWATNQVLASIGIVATAAAYVVWSVDLWRIGWRVTAALGAGAGLLPAVLLLSGRIEMNITGAVLAYSANALWASWLGVMLRLGAGRSARQRGVGSIAPFAGGRA